MILPYIMTYRNYLKMATKRFLYEMICNEMIGANLFHSWNEICVELLGKKNLEGFDLRI